MNIEKKEPIKAVSELLKGNIKLTNRIDEDNLPKVRVFVKKYLDAFPRVKVSEKNFLISFRSEKGIFASIYKNFINSERFIIKLNKSNKVLDLIEPKLTKFENVKIKKIGNNDIRVDVFYNDESILEGIEILSIWETFYKKNYKDVRTPKKGRIEDI